MKFTPKQQKILFLLIQQKTLQSSTIHTEIIKGGDDISLVTVKRTLSQLEKEGVVISSGSGRSTAYRIGTLGRIFSDIDARAYCAIEPDKRFGLKQYNFDLFANMPSDIFSENEHRTLNDSTNEYERRTENLSVTIQKKELERMIIELAWKSSK